MSTTTKEKIWMWHRIDWFKVSQSLRSCRIQSWGCRVSLLSEKSLPAKLLGRAKVHNMYESKTIPWELVSLETPPPLKFCWRHHERPKTVLHVWRPDQFDDTKILSLPYIYRLVCAQKIATPAGDSGIDHLRYTNLTTTGTCTTDVWDMPNYKKFYCDVTKCDDVIFFEKTPFLT